ncbi:DsrE family protein [Pseudidiomarina terrestris]|uniref:DsrE family protein n=1 Tax=Pseudidiomarina terrestris TaxID=2820060 RepID=UPI0026558A88|nr:MULTISPECIES: DsrE family protein [unclassified Pseudidiomarina]MDN7126455.1 DsrE family protein [Pseudidiomarina sp. 1APR75-33.1]MDN7135197.1 DsrE family protein [Pseudidiomarina sp. 1ASP75-5]MDN7137869.1 DsrE family protein [Pseudidiomarina sp. 1ASP75-14]
MTTFIVQTHPPAAIDSWHGQDMLLALATLELNPQLVLLGDAVAHLRHNHDVSRQQRSLQKRYALLDLYDCPPPVVVAEELSKLGITGADFVCEVAVMSYHQLSQQLLQSTKVIRF